MTHLAANLRKSHSASLQEGSPSRDGQMWGGGLRAICPKSFLRHIAGEVAVELEAQCSSEDPQTAPGLQGLTRLDPCSVVKWRSCPFLIWDAAPVFLAVDLGQVSSPNAC